MTAFSNAERQAVIERSKGRCDLCGMPVKVGHFHHRRPRGMGGTKRASSGDPSNCLLLHPRCHADIESNRERSLANGWLVPQYQDPRDIPVKLWLGFMYLHSDGTVSESHGDEPSEPRPGSP